MTKLRTFRFELKGSSSLEVPAVVFFFDRLRTRAADSLGNSRVSMSRHLRAKTLTLLPRKVVTRSRMFTEVSVCWRSLARACHIRRYHSISKTTLMCLFSHWTLQDTPQDQSHTLGHGAVYPSGIAFTFRARFAVRSRDVRRPHPEDEIDDANRSSPASSRTVKNCSQDGFAKISPHEQL